MNNKIISLKKIGKNIFEIIFENEYIAKSGKPGQFLIVMSDRKSEKIPLTIVDIQGKNITLIVQNAGYSTNKIINMKIGSHIYSVVGPLGTPSNIKKINGKVILIGGGVGIAGIYFQLKHYK